MMRNIFTRVKNKIDTAANWTAHDTVLLKGEFGIEVDWDISGVVDLKDAQFTYEEVM